MNLQEYLQFVSSAQSLEELWTAHTEQMGEYGFDRLLYGFTRFLAKNSFGDPEDFLVLTNHSNEYVEGFINSGLFFHAPMTRWARENEGAASWQLITQMMESKTLTAEERRVYDFNARMGVTVGYTIGFNSASKRSRAALSLCARPGLSQDDIDAVWDEHGDEILLMNNIAHLKILTLPYSSPNRSLTPRQREALEWVGDGKATQDIALLMGLTSATVEKHLRLARTSLSVETTAQAVLKAALHNQMFVIEA